MKVLKYLVGLGLLIIAFVAASNLLMVGCSKEQILADKELRQKKVDCILILGAGVYKDNRPSPMLADRLDKGIKLYKAGVSKKILVSGDHGQAHYDEVNVMKKYLLKAGIPSQDIFMDHAGFTTYDSMYRARDVFGVKKAVIVTQEYHMYRSLYIANSLGLEAYGACAAPIEYVGAKRRTVREWLARDKAVVMCLLKVQPKFLGERIDIHGNGDLTND